MDMKLRPAPVKSSDGPVLDDDVPFASNVQSNISAEPCVQQSGNPKSKLVKYGAIVYVHGVTKFSGPAKILLSPLLHILCM